MKKKHLLLMLLMVLLAPWAVKAQTALLEENFDAMSSIATSYSATDWFAYNAGSGNNWILNTGSSYAHSGSNSAQYTYSSSYDANCYLVSSPFDVSAKMDELNISLYEMVRSSSYAETFEVFLVKASDVTTAAEVVSATHYAAIASASYNNASYAEVTGTNSDAELAGQSVRLVVHCTSIKDKWNLYIDDITVTETVVESCPKPKNLEATNITAESATLTWTTSEAPSNGFNVRYRTAEIPNPTFFDSFEDGLTQWTIIRNGEGTEYTDWRQFDGSFNDPIPAHSGTYMAMSRSWNQQVAYNVDNWLITPLVTLDGTLRFWVRDDGQYHEHYDVYVSTTGNDIADFGSTPFYEPGNASGSWTEVTVDLSSFAGVSGYVALRHTDNDQDFLLIDDFGIYGDPIPAGAWTNTTSNTNSKDIAGLTEETLYDFEVQSNCGGETSDWAASTFTTNPSCMPVANLAVSDVTTTTVSLTWTDQNNGSASYVITDGDDNAVTVTNLTATGCTVIELKANTLYTFKVSADCGSTVETIQVKTECDALSTIPYNEGFEASSEIIYCWDLDEFGRLNNSAYAHTGNVSLFSQDASVAYAILPTTTANTSALMLNFWCYNYYGGYDLGSLEVGYITDIADYTTFVNVGTIDMSVSYDEYIHTDDFVFDGAPDGSRIALKYNEGTDAALVIIDDVTLEYKPACMRPTNLVASNPTGHGATFEWDGNGSAAEDGWQLYISENASAISTGYEEPSGIIDADTNPFTVTSGLDPETDYYVWVRSYCGTQGYSPWSIPATFTTTEACPAPTGLTASEITGNTAKLSWTGTSESYTVKYRTAAYMDTPVMEEDFSAAPSGWLFRTGALNNDGTATLSGTSSWSRGTSNGVLDGQHMYMNMYNNKNWWLITPSMTIADGYVMNMDIAYTPYSNSNPLATGCTTHRFAILISTDDMATWTILREWNNSGSPYVLDNVSQTGENTGNIDLSAYAGETAYIAFFGHSETTSYDNNFHFDNVTIGTSVPAGAWQTKNANASPYTLTGLTAETYYEAKVQGNCGSEGTSDESASVFFTTSAACPEQDGLEVSNIQIHSVVISWDAHGATEWNLRYSADDGSTWTDITKFVTNPYTLEELDDATYYLVQVQAKCAASDEWSSSVAFTTKCDFVTTFPWSEDFESYTAGNFNATCWVNEHIAGSATTNLFQVSTSSAGTNTTHKLYLPDEQDGNMIKLVLPGMTLPNSNYAFYIDVYRSDNTYSASYAEEGIRVFASADGNIEGATELAFIPRQYNVGNTEIPEETEVGWYTYMLPINMSGNCYIILRGESKWCTGTYMDNFMVAACAPVGTLSYDNLASQTVDLHWTLIDNTQDAWQVCINGDETNPIDITESDVVVEGAERTYSMAGLTAETPYTVKVRANCGGGDFGKWSNTVSFTTLAACATPTGLAASNYTMVGADLAWTGSSDVDYYTVQYRTAAYMTGMEEDFSTDPTEEGWLLRQAVLNNDGSAALSGTSSWNRGNSNGVLDGSHMYMNMYNNKNWWLITPSMIIADGYGLSMDIAYTPYNNSNPLATGCDTHRFAVLISTNDMATWTILREWNNSGSSYVLDNVSQTGENTGVIDLSAYAGETAYIAFYGHSETNAYDNNFHFDNVNIGKINAAGSWVLAANNVTTWNYTLTGLTAGVKYDARVYANCTTTPDTENATVTFTTLAEGNKVFTNAGGDGKWNTDANWAPAGAPTLTDNAIIRANVNVFGDAAAKKITFEGTTTPVLTIENGGTLQTDNTVTATVKKHINGYGSEHTAEVIGYYLIASPLTTSVYSSNFATVGLTNGNYDLYSWSYSATDGKEWRNYKNSSFSLLSQTGYLYANEEDNDLAFTGTVAASNTPITKTLSYTPSSTYAFNGWNLIGNPFVCDAYITDVDNNESAEPVAFYRMNTAGDNFIAATGAIKPMEGIFVQATKTGQSFKFSRTAPITSFGQGQLNIGLAQVVNSRDARQATDNAIVRFDGGNTLEKFMFRQDNMKVYIPQDGTDFAVVASEAKGVLPVNVKVATTGSYTISVSNDDIEFTYLHLIDRFTGEDIDLLIDDSYTFIASPRDNEGRFDLVFNAKDSVNVDGDIFVYQSDDELIVNGEGELQVYDVMGRYVASYEINGNARISANNFNTAVYIFRLVGSDVKTQKIVVR